MSNELKIAEQKGYQAAATREFNYTLRKRKRAASIFCHKGTMIHRAEHDEYRIIVPCTDGQSRTVIVRKGTAYSIAMWCHDHFTNLNAKKPKNEYKRRSLWKRICIAVSVLINP